MKKIFTIVTILIIIIALIFSLAECRKTPTEKVLSLVEKKYDTILEAAKEKDTDALLAIKGTKKVNIVDGYVIVYCIGKGISVSSQDYGFYYSEENCPVAIGCNQDIVCQADGLTPKGSGYQCVINGNEYYTEHIKGNIYFYSNAY